MNINLDVKALRAKFDNHEMILPEEFADCLTRLEQAEQDRVKLRNRLDAMRRQRDGYRHHARVAPAVAQPELQANSKPNQNLEFNPRELNRRGWTCGCEPGNYDSCDECQSACNELANFLNRPEATNGR